METNRLLMLALQVAAMLWPPTARTIPLPLPRLPSITSFEFRYPAANPSPNGAHIGALLHICPSLAHLTGVFTEPELKVLASHTQLTSLHFSKGHEGSKVPNSPSHLSSMNQLQELAIVDNDTNDMNGQRGRAVSSQAVPALTTVARLTVGYDRQGVLLQSESLQELAVSLKGLKSLTYSLGEISTCEYRRPSQVSSVALLAARLAEQGIRNVTLTDLWYAPYTNPEADDGPEKVQRELNSKGSAAVMRLVPPFYDVRCWKLDWNMEGQEMFTDEEGASLDEDVFEMTDDSEGQDVDYADWVVDHDSDVTEESNDEPWYP